MSLHDISFRADCVRVAEMCYHRLEVRPLGEEERQIFKSFLVSYFPSLFPEEERNYQPDKIPHKLASRLFHVLLGYAERSKWLEGFIQSFWLDVISRPFLEDVTQDYIDVRRELWHRLFEVSLSRTRNHSCF